MATATACDGASIQNRGLERSSSIICSVKDVAFLRSPGVQLHRRRQNCVCIHKSINALSHTRFYSRPAQHHCMISGLAQWRRRSSHERRYFTLSQVSTGIGDHLQAGIPPQYVTKPTRSTQPCTPLGSLNRVQTLIGWGEGGNVTSAGWQVTLCDPLWLSWPTLPVT